ncbi:Sec1-like protein [Lipomyces japonicus]|uniref:Sec1-like protein n=1 Tax=Lipomyces japonicus TaxID=56871 RepID=UPI0034CFD9C3
MPSSFVPKVLKTEALASFLTLLESVRGKKSLVLDRTLSAPLSHIARFSVLQEHGIDNIFWLDDGPQQESAQHNIVYLVRGDVRNARLASAQIKQLFKLSEIDYDFHIFIYPRKMLSIEKVFEDEGVLGDVTISEWNLGFIPLEDDLLSIELPDSGFKDLYLNNLPTTVNLSAHALNAIQQTYGLFPKIIGKGNNAKKLSDTLIRLRQESESTGGDQAEWTKGYQTSIFDQLVVIERGIDLVTPLMTQLTYEGLIDEIFTIRNTQTEIPSTIFTNPATKGPDVSGNSSSSSVATVPISDRKTKKLVLDSNDVLYGKLRDLNFAVVGTTLNKVARKLNEDYEERHNAKTVTQIKQFVGKLGGLQAEHQSLRLHTNLAEEIMNRTQTEFFIRALEVQQNLVASGLDTSTLNQTLEELIARGASIEVVLRLLSIESLVNGGLKDKDLAFFKKEILNSYGFEHILTLNELQRLELLYPRGKGHSQLNFSNLRKSLKLIVNDVSEQNPNDIAYVYSGYAPLSVRLVQCVIQKRALATKIPSAGSGWRGAEDILRNVSGEAFEEIQKGELKATKAKSSLTQKKEKKTTLVFFLGGITFTEIAALRFIAGQEIERRNIVILTTGIIDGKQIIQSALANVPRSGSNSSII